MGEQLSLLAKLFCKKLGWHLPIFVKHWHYKGQTHTHCKLCHKLISSRNGDNKWH